MLNVTEFDLGELRLGKCHLKESMRVLLHTILLQRSVTGPEPLDPVSLWSDQLEMGWCKLPHPQISELVEQKIHEFATTFERDPQKSTACLCLNFYTMKTKPESMWNMLLGSEKKIVFENWRLPVALQPQQSVGDLVQESMLQRAAADCVRLKMELCVKRVNAHMEHLPPAPSNMPCYRYEITFDDAQFIASQAFNTGIKIPYIS